MKLSQEAKDYIKQHKEDLKKDNLNNIFGGDFYEYSPDFRQEVVSAFLNSGVDIFKYLTNVRYRAFTFLELPTTIVLPKVKEIEEDTFIGTNIEKISCPNCEHIGPGAFVGCENLAIVDVPKVHTFGIGVFNNTSVKELHLPNVKYIKNIDGTLVGCNKLETLSMPNFSNDDFYDVSEIIRRLFFGKDSDSDEYTPFRSLKSIDFGREIVCGSLGKAARKLFMEKYFPNVTIKSSDTGKILYP